MRWMRGHAALAATAAQLNTDGKAALSRLYAQSDRATRYSRDAKAILVFPKIVKAGETVVRGKVSYQACDDRVCFPPQSAPFEARLTVTRRRS